MPSLCCLPLQQAEGNKMRTRFISGLLLIAGIAIYAAYIASGANDAYGLLEWLRSLFTRTALAVDSITGDDDPMNEAVKIALAFIANKEGFSSRAYPDPPGQSKTFSIAYGHQIVSGDGLTLTTVVTEEQGFDLLSNDVQSAVNDVYSAVTVELTPTQAAALISFRYNIGSGAFKSSTLVRLINSGDIAGAAAEFLRWIYAGGKVNNALVSRRNDESALFLS